LARTLARHALKGVSAVLIAVLAIAIVWRVYYQRHDRSDISAISRQEQRRAFSERSGELFVRCQQEQGRGLLERMDAAAELAVTPEGEPWIVILLMGSMGSGQEWMSTAGMEADTVQLLADYLAPFERAVIARLLESLPSHSGDPVLLAATMRLDERGIGRYSTKEGLWPLKRFSDYSTPPIREIAREVLVRALGEDHAYDAKAWRLAIMKPRSGQQTRHSSGE